MTDSADSNVHGMVAAEIGDLPHRQSDAKVDEGEGEEDWGGYESSNVPRKPSLGTVVELLRMTD